MVLSAFRRGYARGYFYVSQFLITKSQRHTSHRTIQATPQAILPRAQSSTVCTLCLSIRPVVSDGRLQPFCSRAP